MVSKRTSIVSEAQWNGLIGRIYDAALDSSIWKDVLLELGQPVKAHVAQLANVGCAGTDTFEDIVVGETGSNAAPEFEELVSRGEQLRVNHATTIGEFEPMFDYQHTTESEMQRSLFYQEHAIPLNVPYYAGTVLRRERTSFSAVVHFRPKSVGHFSKEEIAYLMRLAPHVYRSLELSRQIRTQTVLESAELLLDRLGCAGIVVDERLRIFATNEKADHLLVQGDGISIADHHLVFSDSGPTNVLYRETLGYFRGDAPSTASTTPCISVARPSGKSSYRVFACPLQRNLLPFACRFALILVLDPERPENIVIDDFANDAGLTPAESGVAALLASGYSVREVAIQRNCQPDTVRSQIKQILSKTGCRRQAELVGLVLRSSSAPFGVPSNS